MTRNELEEFGRINKEIMDDTERLVGLKICARQDGEIRSGSDKERHIALLEEQISKKLKLRAEARMRIIDFVDSINDSRTRQIFYYRYVKCMKWRAVARMLGGSGGGETERKIAVRYLAAKKGSNI